MSIFQNYTGNAMLNNALMTIEALSGVQCVNEITPGLLLNLYQRKNIRELNKRLKSYTMLFTKNGPLKNDAKNGDKIYDGLFDYILNNFEDEGSITCELSGLLFSTGFDKMFRQVLMKIGFAEKEIAKRDTTINRTWFPLIGGLGSDAQALPQAKFAINIHPICIVIMQFLPLSTLLFKGGVLLIDSSNFEFARSFIRTNVNEVAKRIQTTSVTKPIENVKDFTKGNYLLKALDILEEKEIDEEYSDLNLWSFSNSGTGASCEIERVPNFLIKKLLSLKQNARIKHELKSILVSRERAYGFLQALEDNREWSSLYPNVFGSGKKKMDYEGVSVAFLEAYLREVKSTQKTKYAKYLAYLIGKYKSDAFTKYLGKRDAYKEKNFHNDLYVVLLKAAENGDWNLKLHFQILDSLDERPFKGTFYNILKVTHFYCYKNCVSSEMPEVEMKNSPLQNVSHWLIALIQNDSRKERFLKDILSSQNYLTANYTNLFYRFYKDSAVDIESVFYALYNDDCKSSRFGVNGLLRIFFSQKVQEDFEIQKVTISSKWKLEKRVSMWFDDIQEFANDYQVYYFEKYGSTEIGYQPVAKFYNLLMAIPNEGSKFLNWFYEAIEKTNDSLKEVEGTHDKWSDALLYSPRGEFTLSFAKFAIKFSLLKNSQFVNQND